MNCYKNVIKVMLLSISLFSASNVIRADVPQELSGYINCSHSKKMLNQFYDFTEHNFKPVIEKGLLSCIAAKENSEKQKAFTLMRIELMSGLMYLKSNRTQICAANPWLTIKNIESISIEKRVLGFEMKKLMKYGMATFGSAAIMALLGTLFKSQIQAWFQGTGTGMATDMAKNVAHGVLADPALNGQATTLAAAAAAAATQSGLDTAFADPRLIALQNQARQFDARIGAVQEQIAGVTNLVSGLATRFGPALEAHGKLANTLETRVPEILDQVTQATRTAVQLTDQVRVFEGRVAVVQDQIADLATQFGPTIQAMPALVLDAQKQAAETMARVETLVAGVQGQVANVTDRLEGQAVAVTAELAKANRTAAHVADHIDALRPQVEQALALAPEMREALKKINDPLERELALNELIVSHPDMVPDAPRTMGLDRKKIIADATKKITAIKAQLALARAARQAEATRGLTVEGARAVNDEEAVFTETAVNMSSVPAPQSQPTGVLQRLKTGTGALVGCATGLVGKTARVATGVLQRATQSFFSKRFTTEKDTTS